MESGFFYPFRTPKQYSPGERRSGGLSLDLKRFDDVEADDRASLIHLNSTYLDMIDRSFTIRGGISSILATVMGLGLAGIMLVVIFVLIIPGLENGRLSLLAGLFFFCVSVGLLCGDLLLTKRTVGREFFTYTHFPIRFNRKTRMIHVFRHNGPGGVLTVPWEHAYFHIGQGTQARSLLDLRGHVMDGDTVVDTFAVGNFFNTEEPIRQIWKFIVVYMEQGPQALPNDLFICTSTSTRWLNCFLQANAYCDIFLRVPLIKWVFVALITGMRWLVMKSCREPAWPSEIVDESAIAPDDVYRWAEPAVSGALATDDKAWAALQARQARRQKKH
ncbi:DUF6708 domain-containing protein [Paraburkholderia solisilvae]|uniref:DUF6708 domain-containing protein n=1 Tax=Paraburkholderia solisilvae TaxID=624376 RepID=A0A6J5DE06_9BURK|nr:DUF6708 domain-containing protein [Paraburkholderia solisilvae]CAB3751491.1 hypothetical protein LMG29739_01296 [Paraburkholderia solisilvae]